MQLETLWEKTTAKRVKAETLPVSTWKRNEVRSVAERDRAGDAAGNVRTRASVSLADILGAGFTPGRRAA
jgi:hypothetical protein